MKFRILLVWASLLVSLFMWGGGIASTPLVTELTSPLRVDPELVGPSSLCNVFGSVLGVFSAGGNPESDVYTWNVFGPNGELVFQRSGGVQYERIEVWFYALGSYRVELSVRRNADIILNQTQSVLVVQGPELTVLPDYLLCGNSPTDMTVISPATPNIDQYVFEWKNGSGAVIGNTNTITVSEEGFYYYKLHFLGTDGQKLCPIEGSTFAGPSLDYTIGLSKTTLCQRQQLTATTNSTSPGDWYLVQPNSTTRTLVDRGYQVSIGGADLTSIGTYTLVLSVTDPKYPDCTSERMATFEVTEGAYLTVKALKKPDSCGTFDGAIEVTASSPIDSLFVLEAGFQKVNMNRNETATINGLEARVYTAVGYYKGCEIVVLFTLESQNSPSSTPTVQISPETCDGDGSVQVEFTQGPVTGTYRILGRGRGFFVSDDFKDQSSLTIPLPGGTYLLEIEIDNCIYPVEQLIVPFKAVVDFDEPSRIIICESFDFTPETDQELIFTLTYPDKTTQTLPAGQAFVLTQGGEYELLGESTDPSFGYCSRSEKFTAIESLPYSFGYTYEPDCYGNQIYKANLEGSGLSSSAIDNASIRWLNDKNEIMSRGKTFYAPTIGNFSLLVQPAGIAYCPATPVNFTVETLVFNIVVDLNADKICPDPGTAWVTLTMDTTLANKIEWIYFEDAVNGPKIDLPQYTNQKKILVDKPGNYEAVVYNRIGCEMGRNFIHVDNSILLDEPTIEDSYGVCAKGSRGIVINPGEYSEYYWYFEGDLVSTDPTFSPSEVGEFLLKVVTIDGCEFLAPFQTYDGCPFEFVYPNAMVLGDPARSFEMRVSEGITEAELFIIDRQGSLVFHQQAQDISSDQAIFKWDGKSNGSYIIPGTYAVIFIGKNSVFGFEEKTTGSLLVIQ
ncbi:hypothetical protein GCM10009119_18490 [Algoriphagus jejuensis]|uniref:CHU domain-containing protein n=1 Tax=Algoriphagus jejuensis TaxID=419934 RepID=A0ABP3YBS2_9BACT